MARSAGVLLSITSLPSPYGIGTIGKEARKFADFLKIRSDNLADSPRWTDKLR